MNEQQQKKQLIPAIFFKDNKLYIDRDYRTEWNRKEENPLQYFSNQGADAVILVDGAEQAQEQESHLHRMKELIRESGIPVYAGGKIKRFEDMKKYLYTGAEKAIFVETNETEAAALEQAAKRFGRDKIIYYSSQWKEACYNINDEKEKWISTVLCSQEELKWINENLNISCIIWEKIENEKGFSEQSMQTLKHTNVIGLISSSFVEDKFEFLKWKEYGESIGLTMQLPKVSLEWSELKCNADGMVPVVVQDFQTNEVLMVAYMNKLAYKETIRSGRMTYWSRSRNELWKKGETSGHYQFVKALTADCDRDTILARVSQIGAACHTGSRSCFFEPIIQMEQKKENSLQVLEDVMKTITDRKLHPKEGSYTNYLFERGIDKILKKIGEEASEIIIAAKNPESEEIIYEVSDFLYHVMVLMAEKGISWKDITRELANR